MKEKQTVECHNLITKFFAGEISERELILFKEWLSLSPENRRTFDKENELWQEASILTKIENYKTDKVWEHISSELDLGKNSFRSVTILRMNNLRMLIAVAAVAFLVAIGSLSLWIAQRAFFQKAASASIMVKTNEGEKARIFLADSTEVILNSESNLQYNGHFNVRERVVKFEGEAFFNVKTNPEKPFIVQLEQMSISATGTRFNVFSFGDEDCIETTLEEGKIQVLLRGREPILLKAGQQVVYYPRSQKVLVREVATDTYTSWKENKLRFDDTPFEEVLRRIGRKYNVTFEVTNRDLLNLKYTATFIDESIEEVMQMLKTVGPITYKIYYRTSVNDKQYVKPKIVVWKRKTI